MPLTLRGILLRTGQVFQMDRAVGYTLGYRAWQIVANVLILLLIVRCLTATEQGFYYTFNSVIGLQIFFELGVGLVILQFASHEKAALQWEGAYLDGDVHAKARLRSLFHFALKWYGASGVLMVFAVLPAGLLFFSHSPDASAVGDWRIAWILLVLSTAGLFLVSPLLAILEGCGLVGSVARLRFAQEVAALTLFMLALLAGWRLLAIPVIPIVRLAGSSIWLLTSKRKFFRDLNSRDPSEKLNRLSWSKEIWPMQWRVAVSWFSGYFIFQFYAPVILMLFGAATAGRMGMSLSITGMISTVALVWMNTKAPVFGSYIATEKYIELDELFFRTLRTVVWIAVASAGGLWASVLILNYIERAWAERILQPSLFGLLALVAVINTVISSLAVYLRAHKREPLLWVSVAVAAGLTASILLIGNRMGLTGIIFAAFLITGIMGLGGTLYVFTRRRREWHAGPL